MHAGEVHHYLFKRKASGFVLKDVKFDLDTVEKLVEHFRVTPNAGLATQLNAIVTRSGDVRDNNTFA